MKKSHLLVLIFISLFTIISTSDGRSANLAKGNTVTININDIRRPTGSGTPAPRSVISFVDAWYDAEISLLEISFNTKIGKTSIYVLNGMNQCVARYGCDTDQEDTVWMNFQVVEDETYTIRIVGDEYEGVGYLFVQAYE